MRILLTGDSGFIGGHFLQKFLGAGHEVLAPLRPQSKIKRDIAGLENLHILKGDFYDLSLYAGFPTPDIIVHLASIRGAGSGTTADYHRVNVQGTKALLNFAGGQGVPRFVYCSSVGVLGTIPKHLPAAANDTPQPDGVYHQTKYESEQLTLAAASGKLNTLILRPTITYGVGDDGFVPRMIEMTLKKQLLLPIKNVKIHLLSADVFAAFALEVIRAERWPEKIYHVADKNPVVLKEIVDTISISLTGKPYPGWLRFPAIAYNATARVLDRTGMDGLKTSIELISRSWYYDITGTQNDLNYSAADTFEEIRGILK